MENDVTASCFLGAYGVVPAYGGDGNGGNNSNVITVTNNVINHENNCEGIINVSHILCTRIYVKSQRTSNGEVEDGDVVIVGGEIY